MGFKSTDFEIFKPSAEEGGENRVEFFAAGIPVPGGSKRAFPYHKAGGGLGVLVSDTSGKRGKNWRNIVATEATNAMAGKRPFDGPVVLEVTFTMPRPKCHYRSGRHAAELRPDAPKHHVNSPDTTKLLRSTEDAMTKIVFADDAQVAIQIATKSYGGIAGAMVRVMTLTNGSK